MQGEQLPKVDLPSTAFDVGCAHSQFAAAWIVLHVYAEMLL